MRHTSQSRRHSLGRTAGHRETSASHLGAFVETAATPLGHPRKCPRPVPGHRRPLPQLSWCIGGRERSEDSEGYESHDGHFQVAMITSKAASVCCGADGKHRVEMSRGSCTFAAFTLWLGTLGASEVRSGPFFTSRMYRSTCHRNYPSNLPAPSHPAPRTWTDSLRVSSITPQAFWGAMNLIRRSNIIAH